MDHWKHLIEENPEAVEAMLQHAGEGVSVHTEAKSYGELRAKMQLAGFNEIPLSGDAKIRAWLRTNNTGAGSVESCVVARFGDLRAFSLTVEQLAAYA